ncbi:MAG: 6,7-dimethyl-8-ribityllumazine synthase [Nitrospira sp. SG-bin1]|nr:MAG: 6,7-dimethyl-8-ribityllumazine synthase [Nitrospira sp. SG-bin1]
MRYKKTGRSAAGLRFGIVAAKFNQEVTSKLLSACTDTLTAHGVRKEDLHVVRVPGAFEIPLIARAMAKSYRVDAVICLGAVIRGGTPHFEYISAEVSRGIGQAALDTDVPIIFGVLTTDTVAQAVERADRKTFNRGGEAAKSAIEMVRVMRHVKTLGLDAGPSAGSRSVVRRSAN